MCEHTLLTGKHSFPKTAGGTGRCLQTCWVSGQECANAQPVGGTGADRPALAVIVRLRGSEGCTTVRATEKQSFLFFSSNSRTSPIASMFTRNNCHKNKNGTSHTTVLPPSCAPEAAPLHLGLFAMVEMILIKCSTSREKPK